MLAVATRAAAAAPVRPRAHQFCIETEERRRPRSAMIHSRGAAAAASTATAVTKKIGAPEMVPSPSRGYGRGTPRAPSSRLCSCLPRRKLEMMGMIILTPIPKYYYTTGPAARRWSAACPIHAARTRSRSRLIRVGSLCQRAGSGSGPLRAAQTIVWAHLSLRHLLPASLCSCTISCKRGNKPVQQRAASAGFPILTSCSGFLHRSAQVPT